MDETQPQDSRDLGVCTAVVRDLHRWMGQDPRPAHELSAADVAHYLALAAAPHAQLELDVTSVLCSSSANEALSQSLQLLSVLCGEDAHVMYTQVMAGAAELDSATKEPAHHAADSLCLPLPFVTGQVDTSCIDSVTCKKVARDVADLKLAAFRVRSNERDQQDVEHALLTEKDAYAFLCKRGDAAPGHVDRIPYPNGYLFEGIRNLPLGTYVVREFINRGWAYDTSSHTWSLPTFERLAELYGGVPRTREPCHTESGVTAPPPSPVQKSLAASAPAPSTGHALLRELHLLRRIRSGRVSGEIVPLQDICASIKAESAADKARKVAILLGESADRARSTAAACAFVSRIYGIRPAEVLDMCGVE